jgi:alanine racemase
MIRPTVARVDLDAIRHNCRAIAAYLGISDRTAPRIIAVVKANAYGHGAAQVGLALEEAGAAMLACADIEEAIELRQAACHAVSSLVPERQPSDGVFIRTDAPIHPGAAARFGLRPISRRPTAQDRHRDERLGFPPRQRQRPLPEVARAEPSSMRVRALAAADDPTTALPGSRRA